MNQLPAMPGETHPAYAAHRAALVHWLDTPGHPYGRHMRVPFSRGLLAAWEPGPVDVTTPNPVIQTLTRRTAHGPAPYVGRPFVYQWYVGEDDLGRMVAGETTWLRYVEGEVQYMIRTGDMSESNWPIDRPVDGEPGWPQRSVW